MKASTGLHALIQSLTKSEKRYFKLFSKMKAGREAKYLIYLFDVLAREKELGSDALREQWPVPEFPQNIRSLQTKLFSLILRSQRSLHAGRSVDSELRRLLEEIEFLHKKGLEKEAAKRVRKGLGLAEKYEKEEMRLQLIKWDRKLFLLDPTHGKESYFLELLAREADCMEKMQEQSALALLNERIRSLSRLQPVPRTEEEKQPYVQILNHPVLKQPPREDRFLAGVYYWNIMGIYAITHGDYASSYAHLNKNISLWNQHKWFIADQADLYLGIVNNFLSTCLFSIDYFDRFEKEVKAIREIEGLPTEIMLKFQRVAYFQEFMYAMNFVGYEWGASLVPEIEAWLTRYQRHISLHLLLAFYHNIVVFYFIFEQYSLANRWLRKILETPGKTERQDIRNFARLLQLVLQYEMGDLDLQAYLLRSAYRYLRKTNKLHEFEAVLIRLFQDLSRNPLQQKAAFREAFEKLTLLNKQEGERTPAGILEIILWAEGKLTGKGTREFWMEQIAINVERAGRRG